MKAEVPISSRSLTLSRSGVKREREMSSYTIAGINARKDCRSKYLMSFTFPVNDIKWKPKHTTIKFVEYI